MFSLTINFSSADELFAFAKAWKEGQQTIETPREPTTIVLPQSDAIDGMSPNITSETTYNGKTWTSYDDSYIKTNYHKMKLSKIASNLGRSYAAVATRITALKRKGFIVEADKVKIAFKPNQKIHLASDGIHVEPI